MRLDPDQGQGVTRKIEAEKGTEFELPWASMSSETRKALNASPTPGDVVKLVVEAIAEMLARGLFFLRNLERVQLQANARHVTSLAILRAVDSVTLKLEPANRSDTWKLLSCDAGDLAAQRNIYQNFPLL